MAGFVLLAHDLYRLRGAIVTSSGTAVSPERLRDGRDHLLAGQDLVAAWTYEADLAACAVPTMAANAVALVNHNLAAASSPTVEVAHKALPGDPWTTILTFTPTGRDSLRRFSPPAAARLWRVRIQAAATYAATVGELLLGPELAWIEPPDAAGLEPEGEELVLSRSREGLAIRATPAYVGRRLRLSWAAVAEAPVEGRAIYDLRYFRSWWEEAGSIGRPAAVAVDVAPRSAGGASSGGAHEDLVLWGVARAECPRPFVHRAPHSDPLAVTFGNLRSVGLEFEGRARDL